jgi:hypothetical protein
LELVGLGIGGDGRKQHGAKERRWLGEHHVPRGVLLLVGPAGMHRFVMLEDDVICCSCRRRRRRQQN